MIVTAAPIRATTNPRIRTITIRLLPGRAASPRQPRGPGSITERGPARAVIPLTDLAVSPSPWGVPGSRPEVPAPVTWSQARSRAIFLPIAATAATAL